MKSEQGKFLSRWRPELPQPVVRSYPWPVDLRRLAGRARGAGLVLLESQGGPADINRYSILGFGEQELALPANPPRSPGDVSAKSLEAALSALPGPRALPLPPPLDRLPFVGGWVGYIAYEAGRAFEHVPSSFPEPDFPVCRFLELPAALVCDHLTEEAFLVACLAPRSDAQSTYEETIRALDRLEARLSRPAPPVEQFRLTDALRSQFHPEEYQQTVARAREYVLAGDLFQVNVSQRFSAHARGEAFDLYGRLRRASPAPFAGYLDMGDIQILSSSPERFMLLDGERLETRPIKGTYTRGRSREEDQRQADALLADPKENAEHVMIVDLERNDLGRLAAPDSVWVEGMLRVERYPRVLHLVSTVAARLPGSCSLWELLEATFPGGSITGAPKVRAMEVIDELERCTRGVYTGAVGYVSRSGRIDLNIAIRTLVIRNDRLELQVGGGIVADSVPLEEYEETLLKAQGMLRAIELE